MHGDLNIAMVGQNDSVVAVSDVPVGAETLLREACDELERRLRSGEAARVEEFLARHPVLGRDPEQAMDLIYVEYATRRELGESPPRDQFFSRFPQWRTLLERQFEFDEFIDDETTHRGEKDSRRSDGSVEAGSVPISSRFRVLRLFARGGIGQVIDRKSVV